MQIENPTWYIKQICPDCDQGFPAFVICPNCGFLTVRCEETGDTFVNPKMLEKGFVDLCPNCNIINTADFHLAGHEDILRGGFTKQDYE